MDCKTKLHFQGNHVFKLGNAAQGGLIFPWLFYHLRDCIKERFIVADDIFDVEENQVLQCYGHRNRFYRIQSSQDAILLRQDLNTIKSKQPLPVVLFLAQECTGEFKKLYCRLLNESSKLIVWRCYIKGNLAPSIRMTPTSLEWDGYSIRHYQIALSQVIRMDQPLFVKNRLLPPNWCPTDLWQLIGSYVRQWSCLDCKETFFYNGHTEKKAKYQYCPTCWARNREDQQVRFEITRQEWWTIFDLV
jgi:hypothetical protein